MLPEAPPTWDAPLQQLLAGHVIDGYGLLDHTGKCLASFGSLSTELWGSDGSDSNSSSGNEQRVEQEPAATAAAAAQDGQLSPAAQQLLTLFNSSEWGREAVVHATWADTCAARPAAHPHRPCCVPTITCLQMPTPTI